MSIHSPAGIKPFSRGKGIRLTSIRSRLLMGFVLMALLSALGLSAGSIIVGYYNAERQGMERLQAVATRKEAEIETWLEAIQNELIVNLTEEYASERASIVLDLARNDIYSAFYSGALRNRLRAYENQSPRLDDLLLIDIRGSVVLATDESAEKNPYPHLGFVESALRSPSAQILVTPLSTRQISPVAARPVINSEGSVLGVIAGRANPGGLGAILLDSTGLGQTGKTFLVNQDRIVITGPQNNAVSSLVLAKTRVLENSILTAALENRLSGVGVYDDYRGVRVVGAYRWLPELQVLLLSEEDLSEALAPIYTTMWVNLSVALITVVLAVGLSLLITRRITNPLIQLAETAAWIAEGDLNREAKIEQDDEIGTLAAALNSMTAQLRDLINGLEQRVKKRTEALQQANQSIERRALQLQTSAEVSREITSILDIDTLLTRVAGLIRDAFGYYHVFIYMKEKETNQLVLRASGGPLVPEHQRLEIGGAGLNSEAALQNRLILVNDVTQDNRFLPDNQLVDTRSELVTPLRIGDQVIGTLDVQSSQVNAFLPEDLLVLQSLSDQVAIALENARLYERNRELAILEERNRLARELHDSVIQLLYSQSLLTEGWRQLAQTGEIQIDHYLNRHSEITQQALKEMRLLVHELRPPVLESEGLLGALRLRLDAVENRAGIKAHLIVNDLIELPRQIEEGLYRIALEALNNALKHAEAKTVTVNVGTLDNQVVLEVSDDGKGFVLEEAIHSGGMGLSSMTERATKMGGSLNIETHLGVGTIIKTRVVVPYHPVVRQSGKDS